MIATEKKIEITERIAHLREKVLSTKPTVCTERARFYTEVYKENEEQDEKNYYRHFGVFMDLYFDNSICSS